MTFQPRILKPCGFLPFFVLGAALAAHGAPLSYNRDVRPILAENCFACHGPDSGARKGKLRLDQREVALKKEAFVPGDPEDSELVYRITTGDEDDLMPPPDSHKSLDDGQKEILRRWIKEGAKYEAHWAYLAPKRPEVPEMGAPHPVDNFILAAMRAEDRKLSDPAPPSTLARRLSFDLTGLPPDPEAIKAPEEMINALLSSPHYGERMAVLWLDLARYADTHGYHSDKVRDVTPYRDWVIKAFNKNMPYNQFIIEQLAGDLLADPTIDQYVATTFNRVNQLSEEGGIQDAEYIAKYHAERVRTTSVAFLGSTMGCSECHDHKFDPFTTKDFYAMEAFFADMFEKGAYNGDGRYNEGADIKNYPGFRLSQWGPTLDVPDPEKAERVAEIAKEKKAAEVEFRKTTPELEAAFAKWLAELKAKVEGGKTNDLPIVDDDEFPWKNAELVEENVHSGKLARRQVSDEVGEHILDVRKQPVEMTEGDVLFVWVWLDPADPPKQVMLKIRSGNKKNHRAWWGEDVIRHGKGKAEAANHRVGDLPEAGKWVRLEVPAATVGLGPGSKIAQLAFTQHSGTVLWDLTGRRTNEAAAALTVLPAELRPRFAETKGKEIGADLREALLTHYRTIDPGLAPVRDRIANLQKEEDAAKKGGRSTLVTLATTPREIRILPRGDWMDKSGEVVLPAVPAFLQTNAEKSGGAGSEGRLTRLDLARWIASRDNPLTARAFVNRLWALLFGNGISRDLQDLGNQGQWPTHPELLDWLAVEFVESDWDMKHLDNLIVTSQTYQQSSDAPASLVESDPYNERYGRQNARRLPAEFVRDNALAVSGLLNKKVGGPSVRPYQPPGYYRELNFPKRQYKHHKDEKQYRRGLYMHWQRSFLHPMLVAFDAPPREECTAVRESSNTPQQALDLLNDPTFVEAARVFAQALVAGHAEIPKRVEAGFQRLLARAPAGEEAALLAELYNQQLARYRAKPEDAKALLGVGMRPVDESLDPADLAATTAVTRAFLNLHETITRY